MMSVNRLDAAPGMEQGAQVAQAASFEHITDSISPAGRPVDPVSRIPEPDPAIMASIRDQLNKLNPPPVQQAAAVSVPQAAPAARITKDIGTDPQQLLAADQGSHRRMDDTVQQLETVQVDTATKVQNEPE